MQINDEVPVTWQVAPFIHGLLEQTDVTRKRNSKLLNKKYRILRAKMNLTDLAVGSRVLAWAHADVSVA